MRREIVVPIRGCVTDIPIFNSSSLETQQKGLEGITAGDFLYLYLLDEGIFFLNESIIG
jgi:hypothetical protein